MATYTVKTSQNIFDVALHLYGSIEGLFDLLISNPWLNMTTDLKRGMELEYHDYFVVNNAMKQEIEANNYIPANNERHSYFKKTDEQLVMLCDIEPTSEMTTIVASGEGTMIIDWGDNSQLESITLTTNETTYEHFFDNTVDDRRMKIYGTFNFIKFDVSNLNGTIYPVRPLVVDEFVNRSNGRSLKGLFLFDGTVTVDLQGMEISSLLSIGDMSLQELNLKHVKFTDVSVLDEYLQYIVDNYGTRRDCTVYLTTEPSAAGMAAIETIINEPAWNESGHWQFIINDQTYTSVV